MYQGIVDFGRIVGKLKKVRRKGWIRQIGVKHSESVADHTFRTAVLAMCLSDLKDLNTEKLVRMALLHDLHEALIGDYNQLDKKRVGAKELRNREQEALNHVFCPLPAPLRKKYRLLALEYQHQNTVEARLVRQLDLFEMVLQAFDYEQEGYSEATLQVFWDDVEEKLEDPDLKNIFARLKQKRGLK